MSGQQYYESSVDRQIREAQERGDFDNLPGAGKPLDLGNPEDPDWWIKRLVAREDLDLGGALPGALGLRREASTFPESLADVYSEANVREILKDFNMRVLADRLRPAVGNLPPLIAKTVDIDEMVEQWQALRAARDIERGADPPATALDMTHTAPMSPARASWWRRLLRRA
ncbi:MAG: DUF1992 domain-containing protein [Micrococcales bacterium]|nr:DUF1992 domain-containing protein [Micrococcales bacterium]